MAHSASENDDLIFTQSSRQNFLLILHARICFLNMLLHSMLWFS